jgi:hypothetical protein
LEAILMRASTIVESEPAISARATTSAPAELNLAESLAALRATVVRAYLAFRREYYHEAQPDLMRAPSPHAEIRDAEVAGIARSVLRLVPQSVHSIPMLGGFLEHLEQVADIHSISEQERSELHNMTMLFLHGTEDGIQPWYATWLLASAKNLVAVDMSEYYFEHPWDGLLYRSPQELQKFEAAVRSADTTAVTGEVKRLAGRLVTVLRDPVKMHPELAFSGPKAEQRRALFQLKTTAALALGAYLIVNQFQQSLHPRGPRSAQSKQSRLAPVPAEMDASVLCNGQ